MKPTTLAEPEVAVSANRSLDSRLANCFAPLTSQAAAASLVRSNAQYAQLAGDYDRASPRIEALREIAHRSLRLAPGDTVIDVGCGTGKSLEFLSRTVGAKGRLIAIESCREMMAVASDRVACGAMKNVELTESEVTADALPVPARSIDTLLFMFTHDVVQSSASIETLRACKPGARIALAGGKLFRGPLSILNPRVEWRQRQYCTTFENYDAPWRKLFASDALTNTRASEVHGFRVYRLWRARRVDSRQRPHRSN